MNDNKAKEQKRGELKELLRRQHEALKLPSRKLAPARYKRGMWPDGTIYVYKI